jgi:hypothetical protein
MTELSKLFLLVLISLFIHSCNEPEKNIQVFDSRKRVKINGDIETYAKKHIKLQLRIPNTEKFTYKIYKEHMDNDDKIDAIITVNRIEFAIIEANKSPNPAKKAELGFMGNYNYIFYYDGGLDLISPPITIPSSPLVPLNVTFTNINSGDFKDFLIDFRIRNASYKDVYTIANHTPRRVFQWKNFDGLGSKNVEAYSIQFSAIGQYSNSKDILIYEASIESPPETSDLNTYEPKIKATNKLIHTFFYLEKEGKYFTKQ